MRACIVILALGSAGCFTTTHRNASTPFVRSVATNLDVLAVDSCQITRTEENHYNVIDKLFLHDILGGNTTEVHLSNEGCFVTFVPLAPDVPVTTPTPGAP